MANLITYQSGNIDGATTFKGAATSTGAAQTTISTSTNTTTSYVYSSTFTVTNAVVIEGVLVHCSRNNTTGTVSVALSDDNGVTATREVTVNASDLPTNRAWVFFKFGTTLTGDGGTDYRVGIKGSSTGNAAFFRDGTAGNWNRLLRTNTTATIAATDVLYIQDDLTGAGTRDSIDVTVVGDLSATTLGFVWVGEGGVLQYSTTASSTHALKLAGNLIVMGGATFNMGTSDTPVPRSSTASLQFACSSNVQYGLEIMTGTFNAYGESRSSGKNVTWCLLNTDEAVNSTSLGVDTDTGWLDNDEIVLGGTRLDSTINSFQRGALNGNATSNTLTVDGFGGVGGGLTIAASGTHPRQAEVINLTRNVRIFGASASLQTFMRFDAGSAVNMEWVQCYWMGSSTTDKRGININMTSGTCSMRYCSFHDFSVTNTTGSTIFITTGAIAVTFQHNVVYFCAGPFIQINGATSNTIVIDNNVFIRTNGTAIAAADNGITFTNNRVMHGSTTGNGSVDFSENNAPLGLFDDNVIHHTAASCLTLTNCSGGTINNLIVYRGYDLNAGGGSGGVSITSTNNNTSVSGSFVFNDCEFFDSNNANVNLQNVAEVEFNDCKFASLSGGGTSPAGLKIFRAQAVTLNNCDFGDSTSPYGTLTADIELQNPVVTTIKANNSNFGSSTEISGVATANQGFVFSSQRHDQTDNNHKTVRKYGVNTLDTVIYKTASPSERIAPSSASNKTPSGSKRFAVADGTTATVKVWVRESVVGDGTDYNGNRARLILKRNDAAGITSDTVLDTATVSSEGAWEELSGTTATVIDNAVLEVYVDCDGTTGWINVDDWSVE